MTIIVGAGGADTHVWTDSCWGTLIGNGVDGTSDERECGPRREPAVPGASPGITSPLVLDLDGIELISLDDSDAYFDLGGNGTATRTGWVNMHDGFLAIDRNHNEIIDDGTELFGNSNGFAGGFQSLNSYDSNLDGQIDSNDAAWNDLRVWKDASYDGVTNSGELQTMAEAGIASISLTRTQVNYTIAGNTITDEGAFTLTSGGTRMVVDAWFTFDKYNAIVTDALDEWEFDGEALVQVLLLPDVRGWGKLPGLRDAMLLNEDLREMVQELAANDNQITARLRASL